LAIACYDEYITFLQVRAQ